MTDHIGIWQHAAGAQPDPRFGYCTDDVARALVVDVLHARQGLAAAVEPDIQQSLAFLGDAFDRASGRFRNFRGADGAWLDTGGSEDCHARAIAGLAAVISEMPDTELAERARPLFDAAMPAVASFGALRSTSRSLLALDAACTAGASAALMPWFESLAERLWTSFGGIFGSLGSHEPADWPWPEQTLTYENALVPHALIVAGRRLGRPAYVACGLAVLDWLVDVQIGPDGCFSPVGNAGWWPRNGERSRFDQQPIEAATLVAAATAAYTVTGARRYSEAAESSYGWFLGDNDGSVALADPVRGACHDGLGPGGVNENQGAESTLMWLTALEQMRDLRHNLNARPSPIAVAGSEIAWSVRS